jgi:hypothetical protein
MMWSNFFMQEEDRRRTAVGRRRAQEQQNLGLTPEREGKIKLGLLVAIVGATLAVLAVGTEFWVELNTYKTNGSAVCEAAHLGLWKVCIKRLWQADVPAGRETCGPAELPGGERLCSEPRSVSHSQGERNFCLGETFVLFLSPKNVCAQINLCSQKLERKGAGRVRDVQG